MLIECNIVHGMEDDRMDWSSSRNGEEENCSTRLQERGSSEDTCTDWSIIFTGLWKKQDDMACRTLLAGDCAHSNSIQWRGFLVQAKTDSCRATLQRQGLLSLLQAPRCATCRTVNVGHCAVRHAAQSKMLLHLLWFSFRVFERTYVMMTATSDVTSLRRSMVH